MNYLCTLPFTSVERQTLLFVCCLRVGRSSPSHLIAVIVLRIWKPCAHRQTAIPKFSYLGKYVFLVRVPYLCLTGITCVRCGVSFTTNLLHFTSHTDAIAHVRSTTYVGRDFHHLRLRLRPGRQACAPCPITPQRATFPRHPGQWG